ncbi:MAG TPA: hypothetical protein VMW91_09670 [Desulfosporosinus sp.]|nr:hypothetical protein [Desulfosporosinus sp.]
MLLASEKLDLRRELDNKMFNHVTFVTNRILLMLRDEGATGDVLEKSGKYLWRLFMVFQAYNSKKRDISFSEIIDIVTEFRNVFTGG